MDFKGIGSTIAKYAPLLGAAVATANPLAGALVGSIATLLGANPLSEMDIIAKLSNDPNAAIKLKQMELDHKVELEQIALDAYEAEIKSKQLSIDRDLELTKLGYRDYVPSILAIGTFILYTIIALMSAYNPHVQDDVTTARIQDLLIMIFGFYFVSSYKK